MELTLEQFQAATGSDETHAERYYESIQLVFDRFEIDEPQQAAAFCATISIESARLTHVEEDLYYRDAERLAKLFKRAFDTDHNGVVTQDEIEAARAYCRMPKELSQKLYNGCHGRGLIQLTWEENYRACGDALGYNYVENPSMLCEPLHAALSAGWYWASRKCNEVADNMDEVTRRVNGPKRLALAERIAQRNIAWAVFA